MRNEAKPTYAQGKQEIAMKIRAIIADPTKGNINIPEFYIAALEGYGLGSAVVDKILKLYEFAGKIKLINDREAVVQR